MFRCSSFLRKQTCVRAICKLGFGEMRFGLLTGRQDSVYLGDFCRTRAVPHSDSCALVAHGLLRNRKGTEVSHSPTVSRRFCPSGLYCPNEFCPQLVD